MSEMRFGNQIRYCPNCGRKHFDNKVTYKNPISLCCDNKCISEWEKKYTRSILGKDNLENPKPVTDRCLCGGRGCNSCEPQGRG